MNTVLQLIRYYKNGQTKGKAERFEVIDYNSWLKRKRREWINKGYFIQQTKSSYATSIEAIDKKGYTVFEIVKPNDQAHEYNLLKGRPYTKIAF